MQNEPTISFTPQKSEKAENPHPWLSQRTKSHSNSLLRFHNQIIEFVQYVLPNQSEHFSKINLYNRAAKIITELCTETSPQIYIGNPLFFNRCYLANTELQIFVAVNNLKPQHASFLISKLGEFKNARVYNYLQQRKAEEYKIIMNDPDTGTEVWITLVPETWKPFIEDAEEAIKASPELRYLLLVNLCMIRQRGFHHNVKSLLMFGLCCYFLYERRKQRVRTLTENFIKFLEYFGLGSTSEKKIIYRGKGTFESVASETKLFGFELAEDVDLTSNCIKDYFKLIQNRYRVMSNFSYEPGTSIVAHLVNPLDSEFKY